MSGILRNTYYRSERTGKLYYVDPEGAASPVDWDDPVQREDYNDWVLDQESEAKSTTKVVVELRSDEFRMLRGEILPDDAVLAGIVRKLMVAAEEGGGCGCGS